MKIWFFAALLLAGCGGSKPKPLTSDALDSQVRITISIASESAEFCSLLANDDIRQNFPDRHLQDIGKQISETQQELNQSVADESLRNAQQQLLTLDAQLQSQISAIQERLKRDSSDRRACDDSHLDEIRQQARSLKEQR